MVLASNFGAYTGDVIGRLRTLPLAFSQAYSDMRQDCPRPLFTPGVPGRMTGLLSSAVDEADAELGPKSAEWNRVATPVPRPLPGSRGTWSRITPEMASVRIRPAAPAAVAEHNEYLLRSRRRILVSGWGFGAASCAWSVGDAARYLRPSGRSGACSSSALLWLSCLGSSPLFS